MQIIKIVLLISVLLPTCAWGDWIRGRLLHNGQPLAGKDITIQCPPDVSASGPTDEWGAFSIYVAKTGRCAFEVLGLAPPHKPQEIYSYPSPIRYVFDLVEEKGSYVLRRR